MKKIDFFKWLYLLKSNTIRMALKGILKKNTERKTGNKPRNVRFNIEKYLDVLFNHKTELEKNLPEFKAIVCKAIQKFEEAEIVPGFFERSCNWTNNETDDRIWLHDARNRDAEVLSNAKTEMEFLVYKYNIILTDYKKTCARIKSFLC